MKQMELKKKSRDLVNIMSGGDVVKKQLIRGLDAFDFFWELWEFERNQKNIIKSNGS